MPSGAGVADAQPYPLGMYHSLHTDLTSTCSTSPSGPLCPTQPVVPKGRAGQEC